MRGGDRFHWLHGVRGSGSATLRSAAHRGCLAFLFAATAAIGAAQDLSIQFKGDGARVAWIADKPGPEPEGAVKTLRSEIRLPKREGTLFVVDEKTGALASRPVTKIVGNTWTIKAEDFTDRYSLAVKVVDESGNPVETANITLETKAGSQAVLLDSSMNGIVTLYAIPTGDARLRANYKV